MYKRETKLLVAKGSWPVPLVASFYLKKWWFSLFFWELDFFLIVFQQFYMKTTGEIFDPPIWYMFKQNLSKNRCLLWSPPLNAKLRSSSNPSCEFNGKVVIEQKCFFWKEFYSMVEAMEQSVIMKETDHFSLEKKRYSCRAPNWNLASVWMKVYSYFLWHILSLYLPHGFFCGKWPIKNLRKGDYF